MMGYHRVADGAVLLVKLTIGSNKATFKVNTDPVNCPLGP